MSKESIEKRIKEAADDSAPDVLGKIMKKCENNDRGVTMEQTKNKKLYSIIAIAAAFLLIFGAAAGIFTYGSINAVASVVSIDVNPSIQLDLNSAKKIVKATALNDDAAAILAGLEVEGKKLKDGMRDILTSMIENGFISEAQNSILISIENDDDNTAEEIQQMINEKIDEVLSGKKIDGSVISQKVKDKNNELKTLADEYGVSKSKIKLISSILASDPLLTYEDLVEMTVNELKLLVESKGITVSEADCRGKASDAKYIGEDAAKAAAFTAAGIAETDATDIKIELDCENKHMVYEVEFVVGETEYEYEIDALTGNIADSEYEKRDNKDGYKQYKNGNGEKADKTEDKQKEEIPTEGLITEEDAIAAVCADCQIEASAITSYKAELDYEDGAVVYEIKLFCGDIKYEYELNAQTGEIIGRGMKNTDKTNGNGGKERRGQMNQNDYIGKEAALAAAAAHAGVDASALTETKIKLDCDEDIIVYEVEFVSGTTEYEYEVDAVTGEIISNSSEQD